MAATAGAAVPATISRAEGGLQNGGASHVWCVRGARSLMLRGHGCGAERCSRQVPGFAAATGGVRECCRDRHPCWNWGLAGPTPGLQSRGCWLLRRLLGRCSECSPETPTQVAVDVSMTLHLRMEGNFGFLTLCPPAIVPVLCQLQ